MTNLVSIGFTAETTGLKKAQTELNNLTNAGGKADKQLDTLSRTVGIVGAALAAIGTTQLAKDVIAYSDSWKSVTSQLRQVTDSEKELLSVRKQVVALANQTRTGLEETASLYAAIDRSTTRLGYSSAQQIEITRTLNNLFVSSGKSAQEMSGAIRQLSQGLESGALRGDEFNSVAENAPRILDALSAKLGIARGELREFAATGGITAEILASALSDYSAEAQRLADQTEKTFAQSMTLASNNVTEFVGGLDTLNGIINDLGSGIEYASRNIDAIGVAIGAGAGVIALRYAPSLIAASVAQVQAATTATALGAAWRFMLGPWGLVITALGAGAAAFALTADNADDATAAINRQIKPVDLLTESYDKMTAAQVRNSQNIMRDRISAIDAEIEKLESLKAIQSAAAEGGAEFAAFMGISAEKLKDGAKAADASQAAIDKLKQEQAQLNEKLKEGNSALATNTSTATKHSKELQKIIDALSDERKELEMGADAWELYALRRDAIAAGASSGLADQLVAEAQALRILNKELELETILTEQQADNDKDRADALSELQDRLNPVAALTKKYNQELAILKKAGADKDVNKLTDEFTKAKAELEKLPKATNEWAELTERSVDRIDSAFADVWMNILDGADNVFGSLINSFKRMLAEMAHAALTRPIMLQIGTALGFGGLSGAASAAGTVGTAASGLGLLGSIGSGISGLGMLMGGTFGAGVASTGALLGTGSLAGLSGAFSNVGMLASSGSYAGAIGAAAPLIAGAVVAALGIDKITGGNLFGTSYKVDSQTLALALGGGDVSGSIRTDESRKKSLFRGTKRRSTTTGFDTDAIDEAFDAISLSLSDAAERLGISGAEEVLKGFSASLNLNIKDMTEAEIEAAIQEWVGTTTAGMVEAVFGDAAEGLGVAGESALDTIIRVTQNFEAMSTIAGQLGLQFDLTGKAGLAAATNIVELVGGLDALSQLSANYYQEFYSEAEQQARLAEQLGAAFAELNVAMPESKDAFRDLVESLDLSTESGQEMFAALMALNPAFAQLMNAIDADEVQKAAEAEKERVDAIKAAYSALQKSVAAEQALVDARLQAAQDSYDAEIERISALRDAVESQYSVLIEGVSTAEQKLRASFDAESQAIQAAADLRISALNEELSLIEQQRSAINAAYQQLVSGLSNAEGNLRASFSAEQESIRSAAQLRIAALNGEAQAARDAAQVRISALNDERSLVGQSMSDMLSLASSLRQAVGIGMNTNVAASLAAARRGDFSLAQSLSVPDITDAGFGDAVAMRFAQAVQKAQVGEIADLADKQATEFDRQIAALDAQMAAIESGAESTVAAIEQQIEAINAQTEQQVSALDDQLNALLGIDDSVLSLTDAIAAYEQAQRDLSEFNLDAQLAALDEQKLLIERQIVEVESQAEQQLNALANQLNALLGIDTSVLSMSDAITQYQAAQLALDEFNYAAQIESLDALVSLADMQLAEAIAQHAIDSARLDSLLETALAQVNASLGIDTSVKSVEQAIRELSALTGNAAPTKDDLTPSVIGAPVDEPVYASAVPAPEFVNIGAPVINDFGSKATTEEIKAALVASARSNAETASILNKIYRGQITVEVAS